MLFDVLGIIGACALYYSVVVVSRKMFNKALKLKK